MNTLKFSALRVRLVRRHRATSNQYIVDTQMNLGWLNAFYKIMSESVECLVGLLDEDVLSIFMFLYLTDARQNIQCIAPHKNHVTLTTTSTIHSANICGYVWNEYILLSYMIAWICETV